MRIEWLTTTSSHIRELEKPVICPRCDMRMAYQTDMKTHAQTHLNAGLRQSYPCSVCGMLFTRRDNMRRHERTQHWGVVLVGCHDIQLFNSISAPGYWNTYPFLCISISLTSLPYCIEIKAAYVIVNSSLMLMPQCSRGFKSLGIIRYHRPLFH